MVGSTSFGKGSIQTSSTLPNGALMTVTSGAFFAPSGAPLNKTGVTPNVCFTDRKTGKVIDDFRGESPDIAALRARSLLARDSSDMDDYRDVCPPTERYTEDDADLAARAGPERRGLPPHPFSQRKPVIPALDALGLIKLVFRVRPNLLKQGAPGHG